MPPQLTSLSILRDRATTPQEYVTPPSVTRLRDLKMQQLEGQVSDEQDARKRKAEVLRIWQENGGEQGDLEKIGQQILPLDREFGETLLQEGQRRKAAARSEALQNASLSQGQPGTVPGMTLASTPGGEQEDVGALPQPQGPPRNRAEQLFMQARMKAVPLQSAPLPGVQTPATQQPVIVPGVNGAPTILRPQSAEQIAQQKNTDAENAARLERQKNTYTITDPTTGRVITAPKDILDNLLTQIGENQRQQNALSTPKPDNSVTPFEAWQKQNPGASVSEWVKLQKTDQGSEDGGLDLSPEGLDVAALQYAKTGQLPALGQGKASTAARSRIINRAAKLYPDLDVTANRADVDANRASLTGLQKNRDAVVSFENTALKNLNQFLDLANKISDTNSPLLNTPLRNINRNVLGSADLAAYDAARRVAINEIAKVTNNPGLTGVMSDSARHEVESLIPENATLGQIRSVARTLKQDMANRHTELDAQIKGIQDRLKVRPGQSGANAPIVQQNKKTGEFRHSVDGGKTWLPGKQ